MAFDEIADVRADFIITSTSGTPNYASAGPV